MTRGQVLRMIWIDAFVEHGEFALQREHIRLVFDLSIPQASLDLSRFQQLFPNRLSYDKSRKGYFAAAGSTAVFTEHDHSAVFVACAVAARAAERIEAQLS